MSALRWPTGTRASRSENSSAMRRRWLPMRAAELDPANVFAWSSKARLLRTLKRYEEALVAIGRAIELDPNNASIYGENAYNLEYLKRYEEAITWYERAIELDPQYAFAYRSKGYCLNQL